MSTLWASNPLTAAKLSPHIWAKTDRGHCVCVCEPQTTLTQMPQTISSDTDNRDYPLVKNQHISSSEQYKHTHLCVPCGLQLVCVLGVLWLSSRFCPTGLNALQETTVVSAPPLSITHCAHKQPHRSWHTAFHVHDPATPTQVSQRQSRRWSMRREEKTREREREQQTGRENRESSVCVYV